MIAGRGTRARGKRAAEAVMASVSADVRSGSSVWLHSFAMPEEQAKKGRVLIWEQVPPDEVLQDETVGKLFEPPKERKRWDRASITLNTHPLHRHPRLGPEDLHLPRRTSWLRLAGDAVAITFLVLLACAFPLWIAGVIVDSDLRWEWAAAAAIALFCGAALFARGLSDEERPPEDFHTGP